MHASDLSQAAFAEASEKYDNPKVLPWQCVRVLIAHATLTKKVGADVGLVGFEDGEYVGVAVGRLVGATVGFDVGAHVSPMMVGLRVTTFV